ncbi:ribonuclease Y [Candidatus Palauibacter sp.]|uniref:ribonuclease Y n=1 Tax=Candidatus Palauibacter sp. TaxID=3101350 RepID=UPI003B59A392
MLESITQPTVLLAIAGVLAGGIVGILIERRGLSRARSRLQTEGRGIVESARQEARSVRKAAELEGREEAQQLREEWAREVERRRTELERLEQRTLERSETLERKLETIDQRQERLDQRRDLIEKERGELEARASGLDELDRELAQKLERIAGLSREAARRELVGQIRDEARADAAQYVRESRERARGEAEREARKIISQAIEKLSVDHSSEAAVSVVTLPSDDMKGRIIGREGRNIRSFEAATGVDVVVDDTPEAVILSCFDPVRREVARLAMGRLIGDGRIHPGRIEEVVEKAREDVQAIMRQAADETLYELGIHDLHPRLREVLGVLRFRTSYGQNQLAHAHEVALIGAAMAAELSLDTQLVKRMGLLHDIGKGLTHEKEGSHVEIGYDLCEQCGEKDPVLNAIRAHHGEEPARYPETFLVTAADAISGARPGARRESFEHYVKRLEKLEAIASSYDGVEKVYAIQAGREIRIMVTPDKISDEEMAALSEQTARRIENELQYPGQIKVVVVRESRTVDFAR